MISGIYAVRDAKTEAFSQPFFFLKPGLALRSFGDEVANRDSNLAKHPEDFALFHLGYYDDETGAVTSLAQPEQIALAINYVSL